MKTMGSALTRVGCSNFNFRNGNRKHSSTPHSDDAHLGFVLAVTNRFPFGDVLTFTFCFPFFSVRGIGPDQSSFFTALFSSLML